MRVSCPGKHALALIPDCAAIDSHDDWLSEQVTHWNFLRLAQITQDCQHFEPVQAFHVDVEKDDGAVAILPVLNRFIDWLRLGHTIVNRFTYR